MASTIDEAHGAQQLLTTAVCRNDIIAVKKALTNSSVDVNQIMDTGRTPLIEAIASGHVELVNVLLEHNADHQKPCPGVVGSSWGGPAPSPSEIYPIQQALKGSSGTIVQRLLEAGADLHKPKLSVMDVFKSSIIRLQHTDELIPLLLTKLEADSVSVSKFKNQLSDLLVTAVTQRQVELVKLLINKGANPNHRHYSGDLPVLVLAANEGNLDVCRALIEAGAVLNNLSYIEDVRPLTAAVEAGLAKAVDTLIKLGAEVNVCSHLHIQKVSLLHIAVARKNVPIVKLLLAAGGEIKAMGNQNLSPLHIVCQDKSGSDEVTSLSLISLLLSKIDPGDAVLDMENTRGQTALLLAIRNQCVECARCLMDKGANVNRTDSNGETVLQSSIRSGNDVMVQMLINNGANVNSGRFLGCTPLLSAIWLGDYTLTELLLDAGADVTALRQDRQESAIQMSIEGQNDDVLEFVLQTHKVNVNHRSDSGDTALMLAARAGTLRACELLIGNGALLNLTDQNQEETALSLSVYFGKEDNACLLIREGADLNIADHT